MLDVYGKLGGGGEVEKRPRFRILQERGSLLVTTGGMYTDFLHGIGEVLVDEELGEDGIVNWSLLGDAEEFAEGRRERLTRVSLTFRDVLKVKKLGAGLNFLGKR